MIGGAAQRAPIEPLDSASFHLDHARPDATFAQSCHELVGAVSRVCNQGVGLHALSKLLLHQILGGLDCEGLAFFGSSQKSWAIKSARIQETWTLRRLTPNRPRCDAAGNICVGNPGRWHGSDSTLAKPAIRRSRYGNASTVSLTGSFPPPKNPETEPDTIAKYCFLPSA